MPKGLSRPLILFLAVALLLGGAECVRRIEEPEQVDILPGFRYLDAVTVQPEGLFVESEQELQLRAPMEVDYGWYISELRVWRVDAVGDTLAEIGRLWDDGNVVIHGDATPADGVYNGRILGLYFDAPQTYHIRLESYGGNGEDVASAWSDVIDLPVIVPTEQADLDAIAAQLSHLETEFAALLDGGSEPAAARSQLLAWLAAQPGLSGASLSPDGYTLWAVRENGVTAGFPLPAWTDGPVFGGAPRRAGRAAPVAPPTRTAAPAIAPRLDPDEAGSNRGIVLSPYHGWLLGLEGSAADPADAVHALFQAADCPAFTVDYFTDSAADVAAFTELDAYGAICIVTHGSLMPGGEICLGTGQSVTLAALDEWFWDLQGEAPGLVILGQDGELRLAVTPAFLAEENPAFPNSLVQLSACNGLAGTSLTQALGGAGVAYLCGFDAPVGVVHASQVTQAFWTGVLVEAQSAGEAHDGVVPAVDPGHAHAVFVESGNRVLRFTAELINGDFEQGTLAGWDSQGDARVLTELGLALPQGTAMGFISTGWAEGADSLAWIDQRTCLPPDAATLELDFDFLSEEFLEFCDGAYQDHFEVQILEGENVHTLYGAQVDDFCDQVIPAEVVFDWGPNGEPGDPYYDPVGVYRTGWRHLSLDIGSFADRSVILRFRIEAGGDHHYHSVLLLDGITVAPLP